MVNAVLMTNKKEQPDMTYEEAKNTITTDKYYSLVLNEVFEKWGQQGWAFEKKHIPFDLNESGYIEEEQEEKIRKALKTGKSIYNGCISFDEVEYQLESTLETLWKELEENDSENFEIIDGDLWY